MERAASNVTRVPEGSPVSSRSDASEQGRIGGQAPGSARAAIEWAVLGVSLVLAARTWLMQGLLVPLVVSSGSMAPALLGPHWSLTCADCGIPFACELVDRPGPVVCPNCGYPGNDLRAARELNGDRVLLARQALLPRSPRRWESIVLRHPRRSDLLVVKRLVGLPGEEVEIRRGDIYVDGQIQRKSLTQQQAMAILVHDADHPPQHTAAPPRWRPAQTPSRWTTVAGITGRFGCSAPNTDAEPDWLVYQHWQRVPGDVARVRPQPVSDDLVYNRAAPQRADDLQAVTDLMLALRIVRLEGAGRVRLRARTGEAALSLTLDTADQRYELSCQGPLAAGRLPAHCLPIAADSRATRPVSLLMTLFDQQVIVALDGQVLVCEPVPHGSSSAADATCPFAIAAQGMAIEIDRLRVYRDVYYRQPEQRTRGGGGHARRKLRDHEYLVLGDNSAVSEDSRNWGPGGGLPRQQILGPVLLDWPPLW